MSSWRKKGLFCLFTVWWLLSPAISFAAAQSDLSKFLGPVPQGIETTLAESGQTLILRSTMKDPAAALAAAQAQSRHIVLVLDLSNSMLQTETIVEGKPISRLELMKLAAINCVDNLPDGYKLSLITFSSTAQLLLYRSSMSIPMEKAVAKEVLESLLAGSIHGQGDFTNWSAALTEVAKVKPSGTGEVFFFTDGRPLGDPIHDIPTFLRKKIIENELLCRFHFFMIGEEDEANERLLPQLAAMGGGTFNYIHDLTVLASSINYTLAQIFSSHVDSIHINGVAAGRLLYGQTRHIPLDTTVGTRDIPSSTHSALYTILEKRGLLTKSQAPAAAVKIPEVLINGRLTDVEVLDFEMTDEAENYAASANTLQKHLLKMVQQVPTGLVGIQNGGFSTAQLPIQLLGGDPVKFLEEMRPHERDGESVKQTLSIYAAAVQPFHDLWFQNPSDPLSTAQLTLALSDTHYQRWGRWYLQTILQTLKHQFPQNARDASLFFPFIANNPVFAHFLDKLNTSLVAQIAELQSAQTLVELQGSMDPIAFAAFQQDLGQVAQLQSEAAAKAKTYVDPTTGGGCFDSRTKIWVQRGNGKQELMPIAEIKQNDTVLVYNHFTGQIDTSRVQLVVQSPATPTVVQVGTDTYVTAYHPVFHFTTPITSEAEASLEMVWREIEGQGTMMPISLPRTLPVGHWSFPYDLILDTTAVVEMDTNGDVVYNLLLTEEQKSVLSGGDSPQTAWICSVLGHGFSEEEEVIGHPFFSRRVRDVLDFLSQNFAVSPVQVVAEKSYPQELVDNFSPFKMKKD